MFGLNLTGAHISDSSGKRIPKSTTALGGAKARGQAHAESDLDVLLIVKDDCSKLKEELRRISYLLAAKTEALPSILAYSQEEWESRKRSGSSFRQAVERDAVRVV
jgi:hypothetical protein